jgi:hypothetical protein
MFVIVIYIKKEARTVSTLTWEELILMRDNGRSSWKRKIARKRRSFRGRRSPALPPRNLKKIGDGYQDNGVIQFTIGQSQAEKRRKQRRENFGGVCC